MLGVTDKKRGNAILMHNGEEFVDMWVKDWFANETEGTVTNAHGFSETLRSNSWNALHHLDLFVMRCCYAVEDKVWRISDPAPCGADGISTVAPAENALVGA
jgi:hypothetical protein